MNFSALISFFLVPWLPYFLHNKSAIKAAELIRGIGGRSKVVCFNCLLWAYDIIKYSIMLHRKIFITLPEAAKVSKLVSESLGLFSRNNYTSEACLHLH